VFAGEIYDKNELAAAEGRPTINLKSVLIGNGITDISTSVQNRICKFRIKGVPL
jgi:carboxypeptidase C (cathepsin A)